MHTSLPDPSTVADAASSAATALRDTIDQLPEPDLPDLGDAIADVADSVADVAVKSAGVIASVTTAVVTKLNRRPVLIGGAIVVGGLATWAVIRRRRNAEVTAATSEVGDHISGPSRLAAAS